MSSPATQPDTLSASDPRVVHAEARVARMRAAGEITLAVMLALGRQTIAALETPPAAEPAAKPPIEPAVEPADATEGAAPNPPPAATRGDPVERLAKLGRALTLITNLEAKLEDALVAYLAGEPARLEAARARIPRAVDRDIGDPYAPLVEGKTGRARDLVWEVVDREIADPHEHDRITDALDERLLHDDAYDNVEELPMRDIVESLCRDLELNTDWSLWSGDGWKPKPPFLRRRCSQFASPSRVRILAEGPDPCESD